METTLVMSSIVLVGVAAAMMVMAVIGGPADLGLSEKRKRISVWLQSMVDRAIACSVFQTIRRTLAEGWYERAVLWFRRE